MDDKKPRVLYIKNNEEKEVILNLFNYKKVLKELFYNDSKVSLNFKSLECNNSKLTFRDNVDFVHFKNINFNKLKGFDAYNNDFLCICDSCEFTERDTLTFMIGIYELINPVFDNSHLTILGHKSNVCFSYADKKDISMELNDSFYMYEGMIDGSHYITGDKNGSSVLKFDNRLEHYYFNGKNLTYKDIMFCCDDINTNFYFCGDRINIDNFQLKIKGKVYVNDNEIRGNLDEQGYFVVKTEDILKSLARSRFLSILKFLKNSVAYQEGLQIDNYLKDDFFEFLEYRDKVQQSIKIMEKNLDSMQENIQVKRKKISKCLSKKNIGYFRKK